MTPFTSHHPDHSLTIQTESEEQTRALGRALGRYIDRPVTIALTGDLGSGKTALIKGLASGLDVAAQYAVTSPTYNIVNEYPGRLRLFHVDLYRLSAPEELDDIGFEEIVSGEGVVAIEWAERTAGEAFSPDIVIAIEARGTSERRFGLFFYGPDNTNLVQGIKTEYHPKSST
ncbi:MAG: tRNA (adenosine(37)-N6)-threonylcarbamoyltransferase complex ATPase subunit type 1 TsaE [Thermodesulfobacteriota bacterium]